MSDETANENGPTTTRVEELVAEARKLPAVDPQRLRDDIDSTVDQVIGD